MAHSWEVVNLGPFEHILTEAVGKKSDVHRCTKCGQVVTADTGQPPSPRFVEDCDSHVIRSVLEA